MPIRPHDSVRLPARQARCDSPRPTETRPAGSRSVPAGPIRSGVDNGSRRRIVPRQFVLPPLYRTFSAESESGGNLRQKNPTQPFGNPNNKPRWQKKNFQIEWRQLPGGSENATRAASSSFTVRGQGPGRPRWDELSCIRMQHVRRTAPASFGNDQPLLA